MPPTMTGVIIPHRWSFRMSPALAAAGFQALRVMLPLKVIGRTALIRWPQSVARAPCLLA
jgi:hypothetical protein